MIAGCELDALIAEHVMGWKVERGEMRLDFLDKPSPWMTFHTPEGIKNPIPFSTDIAAAWKVVTKLTTEYRARFELECSQFEGKSCVEAYFKDVSVSTDDPCGEEDCYGEGYGETAPLAICRAALAALGVEVQG